MGSALMGVIRSPLNISLMNQRRLGHKKNLGSIVENMVFQVEHSYDGRKH